jgi:hypothetical protein
MDTVDKAILNKDSDGSTGNKDEFIRALMGSVVGLTKASNGLPGVGIDGEFPCPTTARLVME